MNADKTFNCVVIAPSGKLLDCRTPSVVFPAHDGQRGVWYNHTPMFCKLALGIMEVKSIITQNYGRDIFLLVDGGFAVFCSNLLKVTSYDVVFPEKDKLDSLEKIIIGIRKKLDGTTDKEQRQHQARKIALLTRLKELT